MKTSLIFSRLSFLVAASGLLSAADYPPPTEGDFVLRDFHFHSGDVLPELRLHYRALGTLRRDDRGLVRNAVLVLHGTTDSGANFLRAEFAGELYGGGQPLDVARYYVILPDSLGHGKSAKPSDGLRARFPRYGYQDMVEAQYRLVSEGLKVNHLRLVLGTSMGGMHTWVWGEAHPEFMDALLPLACLPAEIAGRNRVWRRMIMDAIRTDPEWRNGEYHTQPRGLGVAEEVFYYIGSNPVRRLNEGPTLPQADQQLDSFVASRTKQQDANDVLYAVEASRDFNPGPALEKIQARVMAVNFADDLINPPELGVLEREIKRVKHGQAVVIPMSEQTQGHGTHTLAAVWKKHLVELLEKTEP